MHPMLDSVLTPLAQRVFGAGFRAASIERLTGGATAETIAFEARAADETRMLILKRALGVRSEEAIGFAEEARAVRTVAANGAPVPTVHHVLDDCDGLGEGLLMERVSGETLPHRLLARPEYAAIRPRLATQMGAVLASVHSTPTDSLDYLPVRDGAATIRRLRQRLRTTQQPRPVFALALAWLERHQPPPAAPRLVHGDFRNGNLVVDTEHGIVAVIDWELVHRGDPAEDLAWASLPPWRFGRYDREAGGFAPLDRLIAGYRAAGGGTIEPDRLLFWSVAGSLRWGLACDDMSGWFASGADSSIERAMIARRASESEIDLMHLIAPRPAMRHAG